METLKKITKKMLLMFCDVLFYEKFSRNTTFDYKENNEILRNKICTFICIMI